MPTSNQTPIADYEAAAWLAAPTFGLDPAAITLLSHSENIVFDVSLHDEQHVVMRFHRPGYNSLAELDAEVAWVRALSETGIPVPSAVATTDGRHYIEVDVGTQPIHVGVVDWVPGVPLGGPVESQGGDVVPHYFRIGELAARIRTHSENWTLPDGFTRRSWHADGLVGEQPLWGRFWESASLSADQRELFAACRERLQRDLSTLADSPDEFGLIHADLHLGNLMADGDHLTVIDFDDAGFGWFVHELAVALHPVLDEPWEAECRAALLDGYRTVYPLSAAEEQRIDTFLTMRCLMIIGWLDARKELPIYEHFADLAAQAERAATRYLTARSAR